MDCGAATSDATGWTIRFCEIQSLPPWGGEPAERKPQQRSEIPARRICHAGGTPRSRAKLLRRVRDGSQPWYAQSQPASSVAMKRQNHREGRQHLHIGSRPRRLSTLQKMSQKNMKECQSYEQVDRVVKLVPPFRAHTHNCGIQGRPAQGDQADRRDGRHDQTEAGHHLMGDGRKFQNRNAK